MNSIHRSLWLTLVAATLSACGGGGGGGAAAPASPTLVSIALSPLTVSLPASGTAQLTVTGTYSNSTTATLTSGETYQSSDTSTATVSATGLVTVAAGAAVGATATISATDTASGQITSAANSTIVNVVAAGAVGPTPTSVTAASQTALMNAQCTSIVPFYWDIGDSSGALAGGSIGTDSSGAPIIASTTLPIASASKFVYGMYVVQKRGGVASLTAADINFLHFTSGYTNMGSDTTSATCTPPPSGANSINYCLTLSGPNGPFDGQNASTTGVFDYDSGHEENHAGQFQPEINALDASDLGPAIATGLGLADVITLSYNQPLMAGGIYASANDYTQILRAVVGGQLLMHDALGTSAVCAWVGATCNAAISPIVTEHWHYSIAHWVEDDASQNNDGAFSSPGAFGFYPWVEAGKKYFGVISRAVPTGSGIQNGLASAQCGALIRHAWDTGVQQTGAIPDPN
jgi:hypothetical protein